MNKVKKDKRIRKKNSETLLDSLKSKVFSNNKILTLNFRQEWLFNKQFKFSTRFRNYCLVTGRARGILPSWKVSRIIFKSLADSGNIPGIRKASW